MAFNILSDIARSPTDITFSHLELYYEHFNTNIFFVHHTGITDRYNTPAYDGDDDDGDDDDVPSLGLLHLQTEIKSLQKSIDNNPYFKHSVQHTYRYANHENNSFSAFIVFSDVKTMIQIRVSPLRRRTITAFTIFSDGYERPGLDLLIQYAKQFIAPPPTKKDKIHIITQSGNEFYLKDIPLKEGLKSKFSYDNYNEDFKDISERIVTALTTDSDCGIVLFHGDPGTGKTSYLKHLIHTISNKKLIYMPPDLTEHLSSPGFVTFLMGEAQNSILLIEDAENVLRAREAGGSQAVSNILNISDGILGDVLKLQIVCTFNSKLEEIDSALTRPGRCIAEYRFEMLSTERAAALMHKVHGDDIVFDRKPMSIAEIYNYTKPRDVSKPKRRTVGFTDLE